MSWDKVKFGLFSGFLWGSIVLLYMLFLLDQIDKPEFQILIWLLLLAVSMFAISVAFVGRPSAEGFTARDKQIVLTFSLLGFIVVVGFQFMLTLVYDLTFRFSILDTNGIALLLGVTAAVNEEVFRWSALRFYGQYEPHTYIVPTMRGMSGSVIITGAVVNTIWTFFHARSYVSAPLVVWVGLWIAGAIITVSMYLSQHLLVAIAIHSIWNIAVVVKLSAVLMAIFGG